MRVHASADGPPEPMPHTRDGPLRALGAVLGSVDSVRNLPALYLLLMSFALAGLLLSGTQRALASANAGAAALWAGAAFFSVYYGTSAAGLAVLDEALGRVPRPPAQALRDALATAHRLVVVVLVVLLAALAPLLVVAALLAGARLATVGPVLAGLAVVLGVPGLGLAALVMVALVGPLAAPAVWSGLGVRATLAMLLRQARRRFAQAVLLSAAVSLLTAAVAGLVSFVILAGARLVLGLAVGVFGLEWDAQALMAALFGTGFRMAPDAPVASPTQAAAVTAAGMVFALGLVLPGVVYLRGLCEMFLALRRLDEAAASAPALPP